MGIDEQNYEISIDRMSYEADVINKYNTFYTGSIQCGMRIKVSDNFFLPGPIIKYQ